MKQQQFEYVYLFGAVCPATGETEALIPPWINKEIMQQHLELISKRTNPGRHAVIIMDGAGWHTDDIVEACCHAWNSFINDTKRVTEIGDRWEKLNTEWYNTV